MGKGSGFWFRLLVICLVVGVCALGLVVGGCGQGQKIDEEVGSFTSLIVSPEAVTLPIGSTQQFRVSGLVKSASVATEEINWVVVGGIGVIDATGLFTAIAEGTGTVEARIGSLVGRAIVSVIGSNGSGKTIRGKTINIFNTGEVISSAVVMAGDKVTKSGNDGSYQLAGVPSGVDSISAAAPGIVSTTVQSSSEVINIPMGYPVQYQYSWYIYPTEYTTLKGRVLDGNGNPVSSYGSYEMRIMFENNGTWGSLDSEGRFSVNTSVPKNKDTVTGYITIIHKRDGSDYRSTFREVTLTRGVTLDVGDIIVSEEAAIISGTISIPAGFSLYMVDWGILDSNSRREIGSIHSWDLGFLFGKITGNNYVFRLPATPSGKKFFVDAYAVKGNDSVTSYCDDLVLLSGQTYTKDLSLPAGLSLNYPTAEQTGVSTTPRFEWNSLGNGFAYIILVGNGLGMKWWGITNKNWLQYPCFPIGSGGENTNLQNSQTYYVGIIGFKTPNFNITDMKWSDFLNCTASSQMSSVPFTVGSTLSSGLKAMDVRGKEEFDKQVKEFLRGLGVLVKD